METKELIEAVHGQWLEAKELLAERCERDGHATMARRLRDCEMFSGTEDVAGVARLMATPQGTEFCLSAGFPNIATLRQFKPYKPEQWGIYIDAGTITLRNPGTAILVGRTNATIKCDTCERHKVVAMHGATATVLASGWAVVATESARGSNISNRASDHAIIL